MNSVNPKNANDPIIESYQQAQERKRKQDLQDYQDLFIHAAMHGYYRSADRYLSRIDLLK
jgi:hypothetical protein